MFHSSREDPPETPPLVPGTPRHAVRFALAEEIRAAKTRGDVRRLVVRARAAHARGELLDVDLELALWCAGLSRELGTPSGRKPA